MKHIFFHLNKHIYAAFYRKQAIILDLKKDKYYTFLEDESQALDYILKTKFQIRGNEYVIVPEQELLKLKIDINQFIKKLRTYNILSSQYYETIYSFFIDRKNLSKGVTELGWQLPLNKFNHPKNKHVTFESFKEIIRVHFLVNIFGFFRLITYIQKQCKSDIQYKPPNPQEFKELISCLNKACQFYPVRTKCLEWATTLVLLCLRRGWQCNLVIGVQNFPFLAHAWVEAEGRIIADSKELPHAMAIILKEPFREKSSS